MVLENFVGTPEDRILFLQFRLAVIFYLFLSVVAQWSAKVWSLQARTTQNVDVFEIALTAVLGIAYLLGKAANKCVLSFLAKAAQVNGRNLINFMGEKVNKAVCHRRQIKRCCFCQSRRGRSPQNPVE